MRNALDGFVSSIKVGNGIISKVSCTDYVILIASSMNEFLDLAKSWVCGFDLHSVRAKRSYAKSIEKPEWEWIRTHLC